MMEPPTALIWLGIALCVIQSGCFSGLNLSLFGISALNLEAQAAAGDADARRLLALRQDPNFLLSTVLWGNVGTNVLLTLLADSVLAGALGFVASTFVITFGGEIVPQAYFSRHALRMATLMRPFLRFWQLALYPLAKPSALLLDAWLGGESIDFLGESELREVIKRHVAAPTTEIGRVEGIGALNFMALDDLSVLEEGQELDPKSLIQLPSEAGRPVFPSFAHTPDDPFLRSVEASGRKWVVVTSPSEEPLLVLDADAFLREALLGEGPVAIEGFCHRPIVVRDPTTRLGEVLPRLRVDRQHAGDDVVDEDLILVWGEERRIITGADLLGRLLRGIARPGPARSPDQSPR
jgi:CBS domain containing-hemolysin-like protein